MKKLLSISVIAAMAALPMAANASYDAIEISTENPNDAAVMATAKYVKGAYNSLRAEKQDKLSEAQMAAVDSGITSAKLTALESAMGASGKSVATQIKEGAQSADFTAGEGTGFDADTNTINEALKDLDGRVTTNAGDIDTLETAIGTDATAGSVKGRITAAEGDIDSLETEIGNDNTANSVKGRIAALESASTGANATLATKTGVVATVDAATGSVTLSEANNNRLTVAGTATADNLTFTGTSINVPTSGTVSALAAWGDTVATTLPVSLSTSSTAIEGSISGTATVAGTAAGTISGIDVAVNASANGYSAE